MVNSTTMPSCSIDNFFQIDKKGIASLPLTDFIEPIHFTFPQLNFEIGTVNNGLDALR